MKQTFAMISFCGLFNKKSENPNQWMIQKMINSLRPDEPSYKIYNHNRYIFSILGNHNNESGFLNDFMFESEEYIFCLQGRLDNSELVRIFESKNPDSKSTSFKRLVDFIIKTPNLLRGEFSLILYDKQNETLSCYRDQLGTRPFYYFENSNFFAFSSEMKSLFPAMQIELQMDDHWIYDSITSAGFGNSSTPYKTIKKLAPGNLIFVSKAIEITPYWRLNSISAYADLDYGSSLELFKEKFRSSISYRVNTECRIGSELSGGLDSSGVTAMILKLYPGNPLYAFSHVFSEEIIGKYFPYSDERKHSQLLANFLGINNHIHCTASNYGIISSVKQSILNQSGPTQQAYHIFSDSLLDEAKGIGIDLLFSGFGGDQGISSNMSGFFEELRSKNEWEHFKAEYLLNSSLRGNNWLKSRTGYLLRRHAPFTLKFLHSVNKHLKQRNDIDDFAYNMQFSKQLNVSKGQRTLISNSNSSDSQELLKSQVLSTFVSNRFEYSYFEAKKRGIEYTYPLMDIDLIELFYSLPSIYKFRFGTGRYLFRDSLKGILPDMIRLRRDKTRATIPTVQQRIISDYQSIRDLILKSKDQNKYDYLDYNRMLLWHDQIINMNHNNRQSINRGAFLNSIQILLLQEMQREGEFNSGIRI